MKAAQSTKRRQRNKSTWATPVMAAVVVLGVGVWLGSSRVHGRTMFPTLMSRARAGIQQLGTAVRNRFRATAAPVDGGEQRPSTTSDRRTTQRPPRVVPFSKRP